jgi:hypothetical protein
MAVTIEVDKETVVSLLERVSRLEQRVTELENQGKDQKATTGAAQKHQPYHPGTPEHDDAGGYAPTKKSSSMDAGGYAPTKKSSSMDLPDHISSQTTPVHNKRWDERQPLKPQRRVEEPDDNEVFATSQHIAMRRQGRRGFGSDQWRFHATAQCSGLRASNGTKPLSFGEALSLGFSPCRICLPSGCNR